MAKILDPDVEHYLPEPETEIEKLKNELCQAYIAWVRTRGCKFVAQYHNIYHRLRQADWDGAIDVDMQLPDELMPQEYLDRFKQE